MEVNVHVATFMDADLSGNHHQSAIFHVCDMHGTIDAPGDDETFGDILDGKTRKGGASRSRGRHINNALVEIRQAPRGGGSGRRRGQDNVKA